MYQPTKGLYDPLTYRSPRSLEEAFGSMYSPAVEISVPRPKFRRRLYRYRVVLLAVGILATCNALYLLVK